MKSNHQVMKDVAVYTRIAPEERQRRLLNYLERVHSNTEAKALLDNWGLVLGTSPLSFGVRSALILELFSLCFDFV